MRTPKQGWTRVCQKKKAIVLENEKAQTPPNAQGKTYKAHHYSSNQHVTARIQSFQVVY